MFWISAASKQWISTSDEWSYHSTVRIVPIFNKVNIILDFFEKTQHNYSVVVVKSRFLKALMQFGVIVAPTIKGLFVEKIQGLILSGRLAAGYRLPSEREPAEEVKVSRTIVHFELKDLERMGFICVNARQGTFVIYLQMM